MTLATTFHLDSGTRSERATSRLEFAAAFALVIALHAALAVWVLRSREHPVVAPEPPRTIVARLLTAAPAVPLAPAAKPAPAEPRPVPAQAAEPPRPAPPARMKPPAMHRPAHRQAPAPARTKPIPTPTPPAVVPSPSPPESAAPAATPPAQPTAAAAPAPPRAAAQAPAVNAPPKNVSHVDCNIAQPDYPAMAQRRGETGTAVVRFVVGVDGRVESATVQHSSGYARLDAAALDAVRGGTCRPWKEAGVAVRVAYAQPFVFGLGN